MPSDVPVRPSRGTERPCASCGQSHPPAAPCLREPITVGAAPAKAVGDDLLGATLGNFRIVRLLGRGGMGTVYLGEHTLIGSRVAVKFLHSHLAGDPTLVDRFFAEAKAANLIGHENIVSIFDLGFRPPNRYYLVMEYLDGAPLSSMVGKPVAPAVVADILAQACDALRAAHAAGVVHRDLKPDNIFLVRREYREHFVKLVDFGIAKLCGPTGTTADGLVVGTPEYMAPEQWLGSTIDGRADLYALGAIAYTLATGQLPFREATPLAYYAAHKDREPLPPRQLNPELPEAFGAAILKALAKRREDRFQNAAEMREALLSSLDCDALPRAQPADALPQPQPSAPPRPPAPAFQARISDDGTAPATVAIADLTRAGLFAAGAPPFPPLRARVKLEILHPGQVVLVEADVVRHVDASQAASWGLPGAGFAVEFVNLSPMTQQALECLIEGRPLDPVTAPLPDDPTAATVLDAWLKRPPKDPYALLNVALDAECSEVRRRARKALANLESISSRPLSARQREQLALARERVAAAAAQLGTPARRAELDATSGNFRGVARCLAAGLALQDLESLRKEYLASRSRNATAAMLHAVSAKARLNAKEEDAALREYEEALTLDPLNMQLHQSYWVLKHRLARTSR